MADLSRRVEGGWFPVPATDLGDSMSISDAMSMLQDPMPSLRRSMHLHMQAINLRGVRSHDVETRRPRGSVNKVGRTNHYSMLKVYDEEMAIITDLTVEELANSGRALRMFLNEVGIKPEEPVRGAIVLEKYNLDVDQSDSHYRVGILRNEDQMNRGNPGFVISSFGYIQQVPEIHQKPMSYDMNYKSELEERVYKLFEGLNKASGENFMHPFISRAFQEASSLVGNAILRRRVETVFDS